MTEEQRIIVIGAGPTGLGAGYRMRELGHGNFRILEADDHVGGLASSEKSANGFTYDIGGHVLFSHYEYFDRMFENLMQVDFQELKRESWVWMFDRFLPYPFQNNIRHLPREVVLECMLGLLESQNNGARARKYENFEQLIMGVFGKGMARHFMMPYNFKVWAHPPCMMSADWIGERVPVVDTARVLTSVLMDRDEAAWGPNATFRYPRYGGTGGLFERMRPSVAENLELNCRVLSVDVQRREVQLEDGRVEKYDALLSTMPLDLLVGSINGEAPDQVRDAAALLRHSGSYIVGVGLRQPAPSTKNWIYFPDADSPFYRVTYLSNYSPEVVPDPATHYSLLCEVSRSEFKPVNASTVAAETIQGLINSKMISEQDQDDIVDVHVITRDYTYPIPSIERDAALRTIQPWLESHSIYSRGRFGAWRYEVGNMDHSVAQGVEWADRMLLGKHEDELTWQARRGC